jgi:hypothetical protein
MKRQVVELAGSAEEVAALREEKAKEERIEMVRRQASRRILYKDLNDAWKAWTEFWSAKTCGRVPPPLLVPPRLSAETSKPWSRMSHCATVCEPGASAGTPWPACARSATS